MDMPDDIMGCKTWKRIKLGTGLVNRDDFRQALSKGRHTIVCRGNDRLGRLSLKKGAPETTVGLVKTTLEDLGFPSGATNEILNMGISGTDLKRCPLEVGPQLRIQYKKQPKGERLLVLSKPIFDTKGALGPFSVECDDEGVTSLRINDGSPEHFWPADTQVVLVAPWD